MHLLSGVLCHQVHTSGAGALSPSLGLATLHSILLASCGSVAQPTAQFAASPINWHTLLPSDAFVPRFLRDLAPDWEQLEGVAPNAAVGPGQAGATDSSRAWPADAEARMQSLTAEVTTAAASIIGRAVEPNEPLMAAGESQPLSLVIPI